jgi:cyclophilin family peptidyl-prolyl cis-trans isomerase
MKNTVFIVLVLLFIAALVYFGTKSKGKTTMVPTPSPLSDSAKPAAKQFSKAEQVIEAGKTYTVTLKTTMGDIVIELDSKATPVTANNFVFLAQQGFYDNTIFHRTIKGFMIQGGDPKGTGTGGPGYQFKDEPVTKEYLRGTVAMANSGPNTNGSQFFIMHADYPLPKNYVIFGQVTSGLDVVDKIATAPVTQSMGGENSKPVSPVVVNSTTVSAKEL